MQQQLEESGIESGKQFVIEIGVPAPTQLFDRVNQQAVAYAQARGAELVSDIDESTRSMIAETIAQGLEENIGQGAISERLAQSYAFSDERAQLIARNEIAMANNNSVLDGMKWLHGRGVTIRKVWLPDADACPICLDNADDGAIPVDEDFSSGDDAPTAHPNCECSLGSEIDEDEDADTSGESDSG